MSARHSLVVLFAHIVLWRTCEGSQSESTTPVIFKITELSESCKNETWTDKLRIHSDCKNCDAILSIQRCDFPEIPLKRISEHNILCHLTADTRGATDFILDCGEKFTETCEARCVLSYRREGHVGSVMSSTLESVTRIAVGALSIFMFFFIFYLLKRIRDQRRLGIQPLNQEDV